MRHQQEIYGANSQLSTIPIKKREKSSILPLNKYKKVVMVIKESGDLYEIVVYIFPL